MADLLTQDLKNEIAAGRCIAVVGAGVSIHSTAGAACASWTGLLRHGVGRCVDVDRRLPSGWADRARGEIDSGDLDELLCAAEKVARKLGAPGGGEYARWLRETVGELEAARPDVLEALRDLGVTLATTNYDGLLERVTGLPAVTWMDGARVEQVLRGDEEAVLHLHGHWRRPESVILGLRSYEQVLGDEHAQAMLRAMAAVRCILFVGCGDGLHDPSFGALLRWTGKVFAGSEYRRFRLARTAEVAALQAQHPPEQRLFVVGYGQEFGDLAPFLRSLRAAPPASPRPRGGTPGSPGPAAPLPARPRCFGRDDEIADLVAALLAPQPEPVPILGPPGIGKSNLALAAAHEERVAARYGPRRVFLRCDGLRSRAEVAIAIAGTFELPRTGDGESALLAVLAELARAPALLILDNLETPWEADTLAVEELLGCLAGVTGVALVVTVRGNQRPAGVSWREPFHPRALSAPAARELFLSIAGRQFAGDPLLETLLSAVDRVPLALTLLGYLAEGEPGLEGVWRRWREERVAMLTRAGGKDRLTNMELSYQLSCEGPRMTAEARRLLQLLALLPAGLAHGDQDAVLPQGGRAGPVLRKMGLAFDEAGRLRVLAPLREYVRRRYPAAAEDLARVVEHYVALARQGDELGTPRGAVVSDRLVAEAPNVEAMLLRALRGSSAPAAIPAAIAWAEFMRFTGVGSIEPLERAAAVARASGELQTEASCVRSLGSIALQRSDLDAARARFEDALALHRRAGDALGQANCIRSLGDIALQRSDHDAARARFDEALALFREVGSVQGQAHCISSLGDIALRRSDHDTAGARFDEALTLYRQVGDVLGQANCIRSMGDIAFERSDHDAARARFDEALALYRGVGDVQGEANAIYSLGDIALELSDRDAARARFDEALRLYRRVGEVVGQANCLYSVGNVALQRSDHDAARARFDEALTLYRQVCDVLGEGNCHLGAGRSWASQGDRTRAAREHAAALSSYTAHGDPYPIGAARFCLAQLCEGGEREAHLSAAREAWRGIDPEALAGMAASDGIDPSELGPG